jgi:hypothetical protein
MSEHLQSSPLFVIQLQLRLCRITLPHARCGRAGCHRGRRLRGGKYGLHITGVTASGVQEQLAILSSGRQARTSTTARRARATGESHGLDRLFEAGHVSGRSSRGDRGQTRSLSVPFFRAPRSSTLSSLSDHDAIFRHGEGLFGSCISHTAHLWAHFLPCFL